MGKEVRTAREGIRTSEEFPRDVDHFEIKVSEVNEPVSLSTIEGLGGMEVSEIFMISEDLYGERGPVEVVSPCF